MSTTDVIEVEELQSGWASVSLKFWRLAHGKEQIDSKRKELLRDVVAWVENLKGDDAKIRDIFLRGIKKGETETT